MPQKYMLIFHGGDDVKLSPEDMQKRGQKWYAWMESLKKRGRYQSGERLDPKSRLLTRKNGSVVVDGPFAESKEAIAGYCFVEAASLDEAVEISKDYPDFHLGGRVEVREVMKVPGM